jgi:hypothetical protein
MGEVRSAARLPKMLTFQRPHQINTIAPLRRVYERYASWSWPLIRLSLGLPLVAHGIQKLTAFFGLDLGRTSGLFEAADVSLGLAAS